MPREQLRQTLQSLHQELAAGESIDPELREELTQLVSEIEAVLRRSRPHQPRRPEDESLVDRLTGIATPFEETHPKLAAILGRIADGLSQLGI